MATCLRSQIWPGKNSLNLGRFINHKWIRSYPPFATDCSGEVAGEVARAPPPQSPPQGSQSRGPPAGGGGHGPKNAKFPKQKLRRVSEALAALREQTHMHSKTVGSETTKMLSKNHQIDSKKAKIGTNKLNSCFKTRKESAPKITKWAQKILQLASKTKIYTNRPKHDSKLGSKRHNRHEKTIWL